MNNFRLIFTSLLVAYLLIVAGSSVLQLMRGAQPFLSWLGLFLSAVSPLGFIALERHAAGRTQVPEPLAFSAICGLGLAITISASWKHGEVAGNAHLWAGACLVLWFLYVRRFVRR